MSKTESMLQLHCGFFLETKVEKIHFVVTLYGSKSEHRAVSQICSEPKLFSVYSILILLHYVAFVNFRLSIFC